MRHLWKGYAAVVPRVQMNKKSIVKIGRFHISGREKSSSRFHKSNGRNPVKEAPDFIVRIEEIPR